MTFLARNQVYNILKRIGASALYHANSVTTSCSFLNQNGLMSRGLVEELGLKQTPQRSDETDQEYGIWHSIFLDHVDIHDRGGAKKGPNRYGPVLFQFDLEVLLNLPTDSHIRVTKSNPLNWNDDEMDTDRWFQNPDELSRNIRFGNYDKMLVIDTPSEKLDFPHRRALIVLDDPGRNLSSGKNAYAHALHLLYKAARVGRVNTSIERRECPTSCICRRVFADLTEREIDLFFALDAT